MAMGRGWAMGRAAVDRKPVHVHDLRAAAHEFPDGHALARRLGARTLLATPLMRENEAIGAIAVRRAEMRPFSDKQVALLQIFADQAVIAIENVRLFEEVQARTCELQASLEQQTATSEILSIISASPGRLEPVFDAILKNARELCAAEFGHLLLFNGEAWRAAALHNVPEPYARFWDEAPVIAGPETNLGRVQRTGHPDQLPDVLRGDGYLARNPFAIATADLGKARSLLSVPLLKDGGVIGAIALYRAEVRPFNDRQVAMLQSFADQAVIAIENARLFEAEQTRTRELQESLEYQTATSEVLNVISRSTYHLQPVLDTLVDSAGRLCQAENVQIFLRDDEVYRLAAHNGFSPEYQEYARQHPITPGRGTLVARTALEAAPVHMPDVLADPEYTWREGQTLAGFRAALGVPLLREGSCVGVMAMTRAAPRPFTDKQIELVTTFADQAVIAIENVRLFEEVQARTRELEESLEYQTATSEVLSVISRAPSELQPVLDTIVETAARLCVAEYAFILKYTSGRFQLAAGTRLETEFARFVADSEIIPT